MQLEKITDSNFVDVTEKWFNDHQDGLVILKFEATWCGPCTMMTSMLEGLPEDYFPEDVKLYSIDIDEANDLAKLFKITAIPTLVFLNKTQFTSLLESDLSDVTNKNITCTQGAMSPMDIKSMINELKGDKKNDE